ncbi:hypothetical protein [Acrocarpospora catenulata]|uniref:hypothetical protein n=1 Tax=Acrocarpospora catenulata TaxID=2836182 RepID=UPI001BD95C64|nr:hypothetical protein [Acrocarpospora catenulata]
MAVRPQWASLPGHVRHAIADRLGGPVTDVADQTGGFTPGVAARLRLGVGAPTRHVFVKAVQAGHPLAAAYRHEAAVAARLPAATPAPGLLWAAEVDGWLVLCFAAIAGRHPDLTPRSPDVRLVVDAVAAAGPVLTPSPAREVPTSAEARGRWLHGWQAMAAAGGDLDEARPYGIDVLAQWKPCGSMTPTGKPSCMGTCAPTTC